MIPIPFELSNRTKVSRTHGKIPMNCDQCGLAYETYACWAKRQSHHFCSKACSNEFKKIEIKKNCCICGTEFIVAPFSFKRKATCSARCSREKKSEFLNKQVADMANSPIFRYGDHEKGVEISSKLDDDSIRKIRADQRPQATIAADFGISQPLVCMIKTKQIWRHVDP